jgi:integrase
MSVRRVKRRDRTGAASEFWMIDVFVEHPDGKRERVRKVAPVQTKREAERYERELRRELLQGTPREERKEATSEVPTFRIFAQEFLETYVVTNNKPSEAQSKEMILRRHLVPAFGSTRLDQIGKRDVEAYKAKKLREDKLAPKTVNNHLAVLSCMFSVAIEWERLKTAPRVKWLKAPKPAFDFLTFEEAERLVAAAATEPAWRSMILVGARCGLRQGELLALRWDDVDLVAGRLMVNRSVARGIVGTPKSGRSREVPLAESVRCALKEHRHLKGELVFSHADGSMLTKGDCKHPLWRTCKRAGLRRLGWHVLRHTFASHLIMKGVPVKAVQELLGHATIEMTMRYTHLSPDVRREAVRVLDAVDARYGNLMATKASGGEK